VLGERVPRLVEVVVGVEDRDAERARHGGPSLSDENDLVLPGEYRCSRSLATLLGTDLTVASPSTGCSERLGWPRIHRWAGIGPGGGASLTGFPRPATAQPCHLGSTARTGFILVLLTF
jgi:hypothetical protein